MDHSKLVVVDAFATQMEADLAKSVLDSAGIDAMIQADRAGGMRDHLAWSGFGFKVLVREEDASEAHDLLQPLPESELVFVRALRTQAEADIANSALLSAGIVPNGSGRCCGCSSLVNLECFWVSSAGAERRRRKSS